MTTGAMTAMNQSTVELKLLTYAESGAAGLKTQTAWGKGGRSLLRDARPAAWYLSRYDMYYLYDVSQTRPKRVGTPTVAIDVCSALFTVTRSAKRFRDAAQAHYKISQHGFSGRCRRQKEHLYALKDNGLVAAVRNGRVQAVGTHGCLTVYRGGGYCFHSLLRPKGAVLPDTGNEPLTVEAKPKNVDEPRLKDAIHTLSELPPLADEAVKAVEFERLAFPTRKRVVRYSRNDDYDNGKEDYD